MERLTHTDLLEHTSLDSRTSSAWLVDNVWNPFVNGTGVKQIANNFVSDKFEMGYVPPAETFTKEWAIHTLASAGGAVVTYALIGKAAGAGMKALGAKLGAEGAAAAFLNSNAASQIVGAGLYDLAKAPNAGETRIGNAVGSATAFGVFAVGNGLLGKSATIAQSSLYSGLGRVAVGAAGGLTALETTHFVSSKLGGSTDSLTWDNRVQAMANGGFVNFAMPVVQQKISNAVDRFANGQSVFGAEPEKAPLIGSFRRSRAASETPEEPTKAQGAKDAKTGTADTNPETAAKEPRTGVAKTAETTAEPEIKTILLKQQFDADLRQAQMEMVAKEMASFITGSKKSLHAAVYDFRFRDPVVEKLVVDAFNNRAENGVDVKLAFFKPNPKPAGDAKGFAPGSNAHEVPVGEVPMEGPTPEFLAKLSPKIKIQTLTTPEPTSDLHLPGTFKDLPGGKPPAGTVGRVPGEGFIDIQNGDMGNIGDGVGTNGIVGGGKLMHNKYMVRDSGTGDARVWTGSTNFTDSAFGNQDNNIIQVRSPELALVFDKNFKQLWDNGAIVGTGKNLNQVIKVGNAQVTVAFSPGDGNFIDAEIARRILAANEKVHISSMVISSPQILEALADRIAAGKTVEGIYDGPQMRNVANAWRRSSSEESAAKLALWNKVRKVLIPKNSHPYAPDGPHDYMHNKTVAVDDKSVVTGSHNLSANATKNAENILAIDSPQIATEYRSYIQSLIATYKGKPMRDPPPFKTSGS